MKTALDRASTRGYFDHKWLKTYHTFSFADYFNPDRIHFGALRVLNDDWIAPSGGFDMHPHKNMEIVSIPLRGYLKHGDSKDNMAIITPGEIQVMSAGTGIYHSEFNGSDAEPVELLQIWIMPDRNNTQPRYNNYDVRPLLSQNKLTTIIAPDGSAPAQLLQNAWFSMGSFNPEKVIDYKMHGKNTGVYIFVIEGEVGIENETLSRRDGMSISETEEVKVEVKQKSTLLFIEVPMRT